MSLIKFYAFPPFSIICGVLQKVSEDSATGVILVPFWPIQNNGEQFFMICQGSIFYDRFLFIHLLDYTNTTDWNFLKKSEDGSLNFYSDLDNCLHTKLSVFFH